MAKDDMRVMACKLLTYLYECIKAGAEPSEAVARELTGANPLYWRAIMDDMMGSGYISATVFHDLNGDALDYEDMRITLSGVEYLESNSAMAKVRRFLGAALTEAVSAAVGATLAI